MAQLLGRIGYFAAICTALVATACAWDDDSTNAMANTEGTSMGAGGSSTGVTRSAMGGQSSTAPQSGDIVATAVAAGSFTKLAAALNATGRTAALKGTGPFTVFAPTDAGFAAFETANPGILASQTTPQLSDILLNHVAPGWAGAADLKNGDSVSTALTGRALKVSTTANVKVNDSKVTSTNIVTTNGVIHVIDTMLLPTSD